MSFAHFGVCATLVFVFSPCILRYRQRRQRAHKPSPDLHLSGYHVGVGMVSPSDPFNTYQAYLEQRLLALGAALFTLSSERAGALLSHRGWHEPQTPELPLDLIVVGQVLHREQVEEKWIVPTCQHRHTPSGQGFHELHPWHPEYRAPNALRTHKNGAREPYWCEPLEDFQERCRREAYRQTVRRQYVVVDMLILGSYGRVYGSYQQVCEANSQASMEQTFAQPLQRLLNQLPARMTAHRYADAAAELAQA